MSKKIKVEVYIKGLCSRNQFAENWGGYGVSLISGDKRKEIIKSVGNTTSNEVELLAVLDGLRAIKLNNIHVDIFSSSSYLIDTMQKNWIEKWKRSGWKNSMKKTVKNKKHWNDLMKEIERFDSVKFIKIKKFENLNDREEWYSEFRKHNDEYSYDQYLNVVSRFEEVLTFAEIGKQGGSSYE